MRKRRSELSKILREFSRFFQEVVLQLGAGKGPLLANLID
jgi:hypothetical protein